MSRLAALAAAALALCAAPAFADAIDGAWCHPDGRTLHIAGPDIVTPGGARLKGEYDRHGFVYVAPAPEPDAGATIVMTLVNDAAMRMKSPSDPYAMWRRCSVKPIS
jgi:hypothetical protein